jgi:drug/metabolite transporter (DMT)-like permease
MSEPVTVRRATVALLLTTFFWGLSFPLVKTWQLAADQAEVGKLLASFTLIALRMLPALALLIIVQPHLLTRATVREHASGALLGTVFFAGFVLQMWALALETSPAVSAFVTSLGSVWAPLLGWLVYREPVGRLTLAGLGVAAGGVAVLSFRVGDTLTVGTGELLTLAASLLFGVQLLLLDRLGRGCRAEHLSVGFFGAAGLWALAGALAWAAGGDGTTLWLERTGSVLGQPALLASVVAMILLPTVLAFHWMNTYQPSVPASRAALIYLLESPIAALLSIPWGYDEPTARLFVGGGLVLAGNLLVETFRAPAPGP